MRLAAFGFRGLQRWASSQSSSRRLHNAVDILPEVKDALKSGRPVVALESTIVAHGMPYPQNLELAKDVSQILRSKGVIPATIAVKNGAFKVGLHLDEMEDLAKSGEEGRAIKCSTRDLPLVASSYYKRLHESKTAPFGEVGSGYTKWGATTVAATMRLAHAAGISTFVTGGTGGVHRGGELSMDVSTDLIELSQTPVIVVSAGVKSILDIKRTLEVLETFGVPTAAWKSDEFPAFFSPVSGVKAPASFHDAMEVAYAWAAVRDLGMRNGMLVAVPNHDPAGSNVEATIQEVLQEALAAGIEGRDVTPFILKNVAEKTDGDSLRSNISLVKNNAAVGAEIASAISNMSISCNVSTETVQSIEIPSAGVNVSRVICVGGAVIDTVAKPHDHGKMRPGTSNPGTIHRSDGGVGRNIAETLGRLGSKPLLYTAVGNDDLGRGLLQRLGDKCGVLTTPSSVNVVNEIGTAQYYALNDESSSLVGAIADMDALAHIPIPDIRDLEGVEYLMLDANLPAERIVEAARRGVQAKCKVCFDPTSVPKAQALMQLEFLPCITYAFPNEDELFAMANVLDDDIEQASDMDSLEHAASVLLFNMKRDACIIVTLGERGVLLATNQHTSDEPTFKHFHVDVHTDIRSSNGPGDTFCGAFIHALLNGCNNETAVKFGMKAAALSLQHEDSAISPNLSSLRLTGGHTQNTSN